MKIIGLHAELIANQIKSIMRSKDYMFFDDGRPHNVNIVGVRSDNPRAGKFDDMLMVVQRNSRKEWEAYSYRITTDPGNYYLRNPMKVTGTAILVPNQYRSTYTIGKHKGYTALVQHKGAVKVWRDADKDTVLDWGDGPEYEGYYGINIHRSRRGGESSDVGKWSAGCQVFKNSGEYDEFIGLCQDSAKKYGNTFTYTLLEQADFEE